MCPPRPHREVRTAKEGPAGFISLCGVKLCFSSLFKLNLRPLPQSLLMAAKTESDIESDEEFEDELVGSGPFKVRSTGVFGQIRNQFSKNRSDRVDKLLSILPTLRDHHRSPRRVSQDDP